MSTWDWGSILPLGQSGGGGDGATKYFPDFPLLPTNVTGDGTNLVQVYFEIQSPPSVPQYAPAAISIVTNSVFWTELPGIGLTPVCVSYEFAGSSNFSTFINIHTGSTLAYKASSMGFDDVLKKASIVLELTCAGGTISVASSTYRAMVIY